MDTIDFLVQGSAQEPYKVTFTRDAEHVAAFCTCPAGKAGKYCKHRSSILDGDVQGVVSNNHEQVAILAAWLPGTDLAAARKALKLAEQEFELAKKAVSSAKKRVAAVMRK